MTGHALAQNFAAGRISLRNVTKVFRAGDNAVAAVKDVNLEIAPGSFIAITGPSGSGKSTLLDLIGGLERPTAGELSVGDRALDRLSEQDLALYRLRQIGFVFQAFHLIPNLTVFNNVALPGLLAGEPSARLRDRVMLLLGTMGVEDQNDKLPHQLSGGQQQRVAVARALINDPPMILADEPTGNLDSESGQAVLQLLQILHNGGKTLLLVTHDPAVAAQAEGRIVMHDGAATFSPRLEKPSISPQSSAGSVA